MTEDEVLQILDLVEKSNFDFLELQLGDLKLTVNKTGAPILGAGVAPATVTVTEAAPSPVPATPAPSAVTAAPAATAPAATAPAATAPAGSRVTVKEGTVPVTAPMVGTFYAQPEPGAPPFVKLGDSVDDGTTMGLVEVMKVFNAVSSGVKGVVDEICVESGEFVEHGQTLFLVRPQ